MLNEETYENFWELFSTIPSLEYPNKSVTEEILNFDHHHPTHAKARLVDKYGDIVDVSTMGFNNIDRLELFKLMMTNEENLDEMTIEEWFNDHFFTTNFWYMWQTTFAFQKWSSLFEFKRYMNRMIFEFSRIETLEGVTRTPYNQYDSVILPLKKYLEGFGVDFMVNTKVTDLDFKAGRGITVSAIHLEEGSPINYDSKTDTTDGVISDIDNLENQSHLDGSDEEDSKSNNVEKDPNDNDEKHDSAIVSEVMKSLHITDGEENPALIMRKLIQKRKLFI